MQCFRRSILCFLPPPWTEWARRQRRQLCGMLLFIHTPNRLRPIFRSPEPPQGRRPSLRYGYWRASGASLFVENAQIRDFNFLAEHTIAHAQIPQCPTTRAAMDNRKWYGTDEILICEEYHYDVVRPSSFPYPVNDVRYGRQKYASYGMRDGGPFRRRRQGARRPG